MNWILQAATNVILKSIPVLVNQLTDLDVTDIVLSLVGYLQSTSEQQPLYLLYMIINVAHGQRAFLHSAIFYSPHVDNEWIFCINVLPNWALSGHFSNFLFCCIGFIIRIWNCLTVRLYLTVMQYNFMGFTSWPDYEKLTEQLNLFEIKLNIFA